MKKNDFPDIPPSRYGSIADLLGSTFLISDSELNMCFSNIKNIYEIFKDAKKRFERRDSLNVSRSAVEYMQLKKDCHSYPYVLYDFVSHNVRICLTQYKKKYSVCCIGFTPQNYERLPYVGKNLYGSFDLLSDASQAFLDFVRDYLRQVFKDLF